MLKQFTARHVISRFNILEVHRQATSVAAAHFPNALEERMPFLIKAIQVDDVPKFEAAFEEKCRKRNIGLFVLPPNSHRLNSCVDRAHLTHIEEFYEVTASSFNTAELKHRLLDWEKVSRYNWGTSSPPIIGLPQP